MPILLQFIGTPAAAKAAVATMQGSPSVPASIALAARLVPFVQAEIDNMNAANSVSVYVEGMHSEKTMFVNMQIEKATPVLSTQLIELSNASPAN